MRSLFFALFMASSVVCEDWCEVIKSGDTYKRLGIFHKHHIRVVGQTVDAEYRMFNRKDYEWRVEIIETADDFGITLSPNNKTLKKVSNEKTFNRFSTYAFASAQCDCRVLRDSMPDWGKVTCECTNGPGSIQVKYFPKAFPKRFLNAVIVKPEEEIPSKKEDAYVIVFNRYNRSDYFGFNPWVPVVNGTIDCVSKQCVVPLFVTTVDDKVFKQIESVVYYESKERKGYVLLFTIDDRPLYCFTRKKSSISDQVRH